MSFYRAFDSSCNIYLYFMIERKNTTAQPNFDFYMGYSDKAWVECPVQRKSFSHSMTALSTHKEYTITTPGDDRLNLEYTRHSSPEGVRESVSFNRATIGRCHYYKLEEITKEELPETLQAAQICRMAIPV